MKQFSEHFYKKAGTVKLRAAEKREMRDRLTAYMEYHPLPAEMKSTAKESPIAIQSPMTTEAFKIVSIPFHKLLKLSSVVAVMLLVIIPFMAEKAVPGDSLYAIKVHINEEVRSSLTFDVYQKVEWETERLNRRIAEARLLASEGKLTEEVEAEVAEAVRVHSANAQKGIEEIRVEDADAAVIASIALDTTLEVQATSLQAEDEKNEEIDTSSTSSVKANTSNLITSALVESRTKSDVVSTTTVPAYDKLIAQIERNTTRIYELRETLLNVTPETDLSEVNRRIEDVERSIKETIELAETDDVQARQNLVEVLQRTQRLIVYMTDLEVEHTIDIETIIPIVLTPEEKTEMTTQLSLDLETKVKQIESYLEQIEDEEIVEKATFALGEIESLSEQMKASSTDSFVTFKAIVTEAISLADDSLVMITSYLNPEIVRPAEDRASSTATTTDETSSTTSQANNEGVVEIETETQTEIQSEIGTGTEISSDATAEIEIKPEDGLITEAKPAQINAGGAVHLR